MPKEVKECRACLSKLLSDPGHSLFKAWYTPWAVRGAIIADDLAKLADIEISANDEFSKVICTMCYQRLSDACTFMITVQMNDNILRSRLKGVTSGTIRNISANDNLPYSSDTNSNTEIITGNIETITGNIETITGNIETVTGNVETITGDTDNISWPQPIQVNKSTSLQLDNCIEVEVKQEVLSEEENGAQMEQDWEPMMDIKIEPEEIVAPVQQPTIHFNGAIDDSQDNGFAEYLDSTIKQEVLSGEELQEEAPDMPLDCMLCSKEFHSVSGLKAHVIANHSYGGVKRKADTLPASDESRTSARDTTCHTCNQNFQTATDLLIHAHSHSAHVCYVCGAKFTTFLQLSRHGPSCASKRARGKHADTTRPALRTQNLTQPTNKDKLTVQTSVVLSTQKPKGLPRMYQKVEAKRKSPAAESMNVESIEELVKSGPQNEIDMDVELEKSDYVSTSQEMEQKVTKLKIIDKLPEDDISTQKSKEVSYKIKIGPKIYERTEEEVGESKSSVNDQINKCSRQEEPESVGAKSGKNSSREIDKITESIEDTQFGIRIPNNIIQLENRPVIEENLVEQEKDVDKSICEQMSVESLEMQTKPIKDQELKSLTDMLEEPNGSVSETNIPISNQEASSSTSRNIVESEKIPKLKELNTGTISTSIHSHHGSFENHHQCENTSKTNEEKTVEVKDSIEQEMDKIFDEQISEQENLNADQNSIPVITETPESLNELSEMKVHLAINPLNKDAELFDTNVKVTDLDCAKTEKCEAKLVSVSEQSDIELS